jgi:hypothetical protein
MSPLAYLWGATLAALAVFLVFVALRRLFRRRRIEVKSDGLIVDRMFAFGWRDIKKLEFWLEKGLARFVVHLGASRYGFSHTEATLDDPLHLKHLIIEKAKLIKEPSPVPRVETFVRHGDTARLPRTLLDTLPRPSRPSLVGAALGAAVLAASKAKWITTVVSLLASAGAYRLVAEGSSQALRQPINPWTFALGLLGVVLIHELGHAWVMRAHGLRAGAPIFIPFVGAFIAMRDQPRDARVEAEIGYGGPLAGAMASTVAFVAFYVSTEVAWLFVALAGFVLNLFNLVPVHPLDGARICAAITPKLWLVGIAGIVVMFALSWHDPKVALGNVMLLLIASVGIGNAWEAWRNPEKLGPASYYEVPPGYRVAMGVAYFLLAAYLAWMTYTCAHLGEVRGLWRAVA